jgi:hypothetical protein
MTITPLFIHSPQVFLANIANNSHVNTTWDGTTGEIIQVFAANVTYGSFLEYVRIKPLGTSQPTALRFFYNNGQDRAEPNNNALIYEQTLPNVSWSETASTPDFSVPFRIPLPPGANVYVTIANTCNAGFVFTGIGGNYGPPGSVPIFLRVPKIGTTNTLTTASTTRDLTTGVLNVVFRAASTNGSYLDHVRVKPIGTNAASVVRIFINNGSDPTATYKNQTLFIETSLPATTLSETLALTDISVPLRIYLPPNYNVYATLGTAVAAGWTITAIGGDL